MGFDVNLNLLQANFLLEKCKATLEDFSGSPYDAAVTIAEELVYSATNKSHKLPANDLLSLAQSLDEVIRYLDTLNFPIIRLKFIKQLVKLLRSQPKLAKEYFGKILSYSKH
jgi:hypothetical protein